ncbi:MAG: PIG-L deacetylase family protein [Pirellulales bacterium]
MPSVLAIAAHPDDIEFLMSGTLLALKQSGYEIHYMNVADGCCGTTQYPREKIAAMRLAEAKAASSSIGAIFHPPICHDLEIFYQKDLLAQVTSVVREANPEIVLTHAPSDYMEDHMNACRLAVSAAFCRGMPNFQVLPDRSPVAGKVTLYHAQPYQNRDPLRKLVQPEFFVDTTDLVEQKVAMLAHHKSQKDWLDESQGLDSYLVALREMDQLVGSLSESFQYAEGWRRHLHAGYCDPDDDPLAKALASRVKFNPNYQLD